MTAPTIPTPLDALLLALREAIAPALAAAAAATLAEQERSDDDFAASRDFGGNQDDAYAAGERAGMVAGRAAMAEDVLALIEAAASAQGGEEPTR